MFIQNKFISHCRQNRLFSEKHRLLITVSGGLDSVVLTDLCCREGFDVVLLHCNFQLRGEESEGDELFVKQLAQNYQKEIFIKRFNVYEEQEAAGGSVQEVARRLRYNWFQEIADSQLAAGVTSVCILTAHHADDNIETMLMQFFRGTGLKGLTGIAAISGIIRRPLLPFFKEELEAYAKEQQLLWREDSTNTANAYTRNYLRHEILPKLEKVYPGIRQTLLHAIKRYESIEQLYHHGVELMKKKLMVKKGHDWHLPVELMKKQSNSALWFELLQPFGFTEKQLPDLMHLCDASSGRWVKAAESDYRLIRHRNHLILTVFQVNEGEIFLIESSVKEIVYPGGKLTFNKKLAGKVKITDDPFIVNLDAKDIVFPLILRRVKAGDYFYPLGMPKKKKVARFMIDIKLSLAEKSNIWVLESENRILWVVGKRIDDRFKVTEKTREVLEVVCY